MNEELLQYVWKHGLFSKTKLETTDGEKLEIIQAGQWNSNAGPDFFNSLLKIGDTLWAGNVEVHIHSSDWFKHKHHIDDAYNNVILHVVLYNDTDVKLPNGATLSTFIIDINPKVFANYEALLAEKDKPACYRSINEIDSIYIRSMLDALLIERIQTKTAHIEKVLNTNKNNWNETFYQQLSINFGYKTNALPFEMLARSVPLRILEHHSSSLFQIEALLFGQSGLLNEQLLGDDYFLSLRNEYSYLTGKYHLKGMEGFLWKFMRMRPANFPTIRIAQFAALLSQSENLFSKLIECETPSAILKYFDVKASDYWDTHYRFNQIAPKKKKQLGTNSIHNLMINTVVPLLHLYGDRSNKPELKKRAFDLLEVIPPERNQIISRWAAVGVSSMNASDTQALIQLKNVYCDHKRCLKCQIGNKVINR